MSNKADKHSAYWIDEAEAAADTRSMPTFSMSEQLPSLNRTIAILTAFRGENTPQRPSELANRLQIPRSSAYQIIRTLLSYGYLESAGQGQVRLGAKFGDLLVAYQQQHRLLPVDPIWREQQRARTGGDLMTQAPRSFLWNPQLTEMVNCSRLRRAPPYRIGFSNASTGNAWRVAMLHGILHYSKERSGQIAEFLVRDAQDSPEKQATDIQALLDEKVDLLLVSCDESQPVDEALAVAAARRVPVVAVDRRPLNDTRFLTFVSASDIALGRITAQWLVERIKGSGQVFMLAGVENSMPAERRIAAANEVFSQYPDIDVAAVRYTGWQEETGREITRELIAESGIPAGVWCDSGLQGAGAIQAFLDLGVPDAQIPPHTGGDVNHVFQLAAQHQVPLAAVEYPAWMGARAVRAALDVLTGRIMPRHIEVHSQIVISRGCETPSVHPDVLADDYVRWDRPVNFVASHGLGDTYTPEQFDASA